MGHRQRFLGAFVAACVGVATMVAGVVGASSASATTTTRATATTVGGSTSVQDVGLGTTSVAGVTIAADGLDGTIDWQQTTTLSTQFDTDAVGQGRAVDPEDRATRTATGTMVANWSLADLEVAVPGFSPLHIGTVGLRSSGNCDLRFGGATYECHLEHDLSPVVEPATPGPYVNAGLAVDLTITPQALATMRTASVAGTPAGTANLALGESAVTDPLAVACSAGAGGSLSYALGPLSTTPGVQVEAALVLQVGASVANPAYPDTDPNPVVDLPPVAQPTFPFAAVNTTIPMRGPGATFDLGVVQADDQPITADGGGPYGGVEAVPIAFDGSATSGGCGSAALHWEFSDGGSADGVQPSHTFADNGTYTGTVTATVGSRHDTATFTVTVENEVPSVDAGGNVTSPAGSPVSFIGTATDPSNVDQATLEYTWDFGDGSPWATAAVGTATHSYTVPGTYDVTLMVCDKDGGCNFDGKRVTVVAQEQQQRQRTLAVYFGDLIGRTGSTTDLRAILVDRNLRPMPGRTVTFTLGDRTVSATTDARGVARTTLKVTQRRGLYAVSATWRPGGTDAQQYTGASMTLPFLVLPR